MFDRSVYIERRNKLKQLVGSGLIYFPGNVDACMNYGANTYKFRQDSSFLYYFGLDTQNLAAVIDVDKDEEIIFGDDRTLDDVVWMGTEDKLANRAELVGVELTEPSGNIQTKIDGAKSKNQKIHYLPHYRGKTMISTGILLGISPSDINKNASNELIKAVIKQRSIKSADEVAEIEKAVNISFVMNTMAMKLSKPGLIEREIAGAVEGIALSLSEGVSFPIIFSVHGETLHNHHHNNVMKDGDLLILDSGAESGLHYASDITRTFPVNGKFSPMQKDLYNIVLKANTEAIQMIKPGIKFKEIHLHAARVIAAGLIEHGFMKGDADAAVDAGAHALFFPHGLGHMMGLDVHDLEGLGENLVGYDDKTIRSEQFGLAYLRLAKELETGFVVTVEPGMYFIPELIDSWKAENKHSEFINYDKLESMKTFGGIRIEDDVLVTGSGYKIIGQPIPKTVEDVEKYCNE
jgi:Xaa-Pro aminopeptidase